MAVFVTCLIPVMTIWVWCNTQRMAKHVFILLLVKKTQKQRMPVKKKKRKKLNKSLRERKRAWRLPVVLMSVWAVSPWHCITVAMVSLSAGCGWTRLAIFSLLLQSASLLRMLTATQECTHPFFALKSRQTTKHCCKNLWIHSMLFAAHPSILMLMLTDFFSCYFEKKKADSCPSEK